MTQDAPLNRILQATRSNAHKAETWQSMFAGRTVAQQVSFIKQAMHQSSTTDGCRQCISMGVICTWPDPKECTHGPSSAVFDNSSFPNTMLTGCQLKAHTGFSTMGGPSRSNRTVPRWVFRCHHCRGQPGCSGCCCKCRRGVPRCDAVCSYQLYLLV